MTFDTTRPDSERNTAQYICSVLVTCWEKRLGPAGLDGAMLRYIREFSDLAAERLHAKGLHTCLRCDRLTDTYWSGAPVCSECVDRNPSARQMIAAGHDMRA